MANRLLVLTILLAGCQGHHAERGARGVDSAGRPEAPIASPAARASAAQDSARDDWVEHSFVPVGATRATLIAAFGKPDRVVVRTVRNAYDSTVMDTVFQMAWDAGLRAWVYVGGLDSSKEFIASAEVRANRFLRRTDVGIGSRWEDVVKRFGPPWGEVGGLPYYDSGRRLGPNEPVYFQVKNGVVTLIRFDYFVG